jgi:predicted ThiF/HesA family dinucleotide-utilizing enzyme
MERPRNKTKTVKVEGSKKNPRIKEKGNKTSSVQGLFGIKNQEVQEYRLEEC